MKKSISILLSLIMALSLVACGGDGGGENPASEGGKIPVNPVSDFEYKYDADLGGIVITKYIGTPIKVSIPKEIEGEPVKKIGRAFEESDVMEVNIPNSVTRIDDYAFDECYSLTSITIPDSVTNIGSAFTECVNLTSITIPDSVTNISTSAFWRCRNLTKAVYKGKTYSVVIENVSSNLPDEFYDAVNGTNTALAANRDTSAAPAADNRDTAEKTYETTEFGGNTAGVSENNDNGMSWSSNTYHVELGGLLWYVFRSGNGKAFLVSMYVLEEELPYHGSMTEITWENCDLREYLNGSFYQSTFSEQEKEWIIETEVENDGGNTKDKVFLLSIDELNELYPNGMANATKETNHFKNYGWWLRSSGGDGTRAAFVDTEGNVNLDGNDVNTDGGVRPAMWIRIKYEKRAGTFVP